MLFEILIQMELSLAHGCPELVDRETLVEYIHHNRDLNTRRIGTIGKMVLSDELLCNISDQGRRLRGCEEHDWPGADDIEQCGSYRGGGPSPPGVSD